MKTSYIVDSTFNQMRLDRWIRNNIGKIPQSLIEKNLRNGFIKVNKKKVNIASYQVKDSDLIEVREKSKKLAIIDGSLQNKERDIPEYIQLDDKNKTAKLVRIPKFSEVPYPVIMEPNLVIEYYSR